ncbi:hypothetical protein CASFOL_010155 [Castilleja foliolosa]|uniref:Uncharacterized protein n=1 Tax=Castilleja foliolosa TaxID=1961234 RepID=A0ABD3DRX3_9LAMI
MGTKRSIKCVTGEKLSVPPGFVSLTAFTLKRKAADSTAVGDESEPEAVYAPLNNGDIEKFKASLVHRPWICSDQFDRIPHEHDSDRSVNELVTSRRHPKVSCLPTLDDAPVFRPTEEEFKDTLKYIAKIRPKAEGYGICRIVPPPSWRLPPSLLEDDKASKFTTRVQKIDRLRHFYFNHEEMEIKMPKVEHGPEFTLKSFKKYADDFKAQHFGKNGTVIDRRGPIIARIEDEYWRIIEKPSKEVKVLYGANLGSGFSDLDNPAKSRAEYVESGWKLKNINKLSGSLLPFGCYNNSDISSPQLFIGMCFASQGWINEEHHLYSITYLHSGDPKICYGIPGRYCFKFLEIVKKMYPQLLKHPELLHELAPQLSPSLLMSEGIPVCRCVQNPMEFVVTFPGAYHTEFSCGYNISESAFFAPFDWLSHGQDIVELYAEHCLKTSISHDKLLLGAAIEAVSAQRETLAFRNNSVNNRLWTSACGKDGILTRVLKSRVRNEGIRRSHLCDMELSSALDDLGVTTKLECTICSYDLYLSAVSCSCSPNTYSCLRHAKQLCSCPWSSKHFFFRYEITELNLLVEALEGSLKAIHSWTKKKVQQGALQPLDSDVKSSQKDVVISPVQNVVVLSDDEDDPHCC